MDFLRSCCYQILITLITIVMGVAFLPLLLQKRPALKYFVPYWWSKCALWLQHHVLRLRYEVLGRENIVADGGVIYAVKHQSAWETLALWHILHHPIFVLKKELLDIPIFGWYLCQGDNIVIDRSSGSKAIGQIVEQSREYLGQQRNIVIFPEGTRTAVGANVRYKAGVGALYQSLQPTIIPVALNSGCFWKRNAFVRKSGVVRIQFLPAMPTNLSRDEFMQQLQSTIELATNELVKHQINE
jgi:1-acyl-sn-glycerol-3-phosphate acyltransferase